LKAIISYGSAAAEGTDILYQRVAPSIRKKTKILKQRHIYWQQF